MHGFMSTQMEEKRVLQWFSTPQVESHHVLYFLCMVTIFYLQNSESVSLDKNIDPSYDSEILSSKQEKSRRPT